MTPGPGLYIPHEFVAGVPGLDPPDRCEICRNPQDHVVHLPLSAEDDVHDEIKPSRTPQERLARMGDALSDSFPTLPEYRPGDKVIIFISDDKRSGICISGYEGEDENDEVRQATVDLFMHLRAMLKSTGVDLDFIGIPESPEGIEL